MKKHILILTSITLFIATSCTKYPEACFTTPSYEVKTNENVAFTNCSQNAHSYEWNFGDGTSLNTEENPNHTFTSPGSYNVSLRAYSKNEKKSNEFVFTISVIEDSNDTSNTPLNPLEGSYDYTEVYTYDYDQAGSGNADVGGTAFLESLSENQLRLASLFQADAFSNVVLTIQNDSVYIEEQSKLSIVINETITIQGSGHFPYEDQLIFDYTVFSQNGDTLGFGQWNGIKQ